MSKNTNNAGKGDKPRNCFSKQYKDNFDEINWEKEIKGWLKRDVEIGDIDGVKMKKYENHLDELISCLLGEKDPVYLITNESTVGHFYNDKKHPVRVKQLMKKYNLDSISESDYIIDVAEKMYNFRPF